MLRGEIRVARCRAELSRGGSNGTSLSREEEMVDQGERPEFRWLERGEGQAVLLLHGLIGQMHHWDGVLDGLADHCRAIALYAAFDPTTTAGSENRQAHLRDEAELLQLAASSTPSTCNLKPVSFVKPIGEENEHPGYTSESVGSDHLVALIDAIAKTGCAKDTMIIVTYDEFGGQWDHVPPPGQGNSAGPHATIERRYGLQPLGTRDAAIEDLSNVFGAKF